MTIETFAIVAFFILGFGLISGYLEKTVITPPMVFVTFGLFLSPQGLGLINLDPDSEGIRLIAELTLILVLFTDASRINLQRLEWEFTLPLRLLGIALPIIVGLGTILGVLIFPQQLNTWEAAVLATILAPTDAALSQAVVNSSRVPVCIRQAINVETGLNDGICIPVLLLFFSLAEIEGQGESTAFWLVFTIEQILLGPFVGITIGYIAGWLVSASVNRKLINQAFESLSVIGISVLAYASAELVGGNGLIAAFCAGLTVGNTATAICQCLYEFGEAEGQLLILIIFLIFGATMVFPTLESLNWRMIVYAVISLTLVRLIGVRISTMGLNLQWTTTFFVGWFGPRGVASVLYGLLLLNQKAIAGRELIFSVMVITVLLSVFAHGLSAFPAANWYGKHMEQASEDLPEMKLVHDLPVRLPWLDMSRR
ncbi:MAG: sodium:proton antiporter [Cyanobacteria bacterium]|jgi:NhaP-type Na+/H+ or K+/H+ antiporter|nr:sodium:proton antiporter [Cyanobacteria bacterium GSL.Bin1]